MWLGNLCFESSAQIPALGACLGWGLVADLVLNMRLGLAFGLGLGWGQDRG